MTTNFDPAVWMLTMDDLLARLPYPTLRGSLQAALHSGLRAEFQRHAEGGSDWEDMAGRIGPVAWAWPGWLPEGLLTILAGESGTGKSLLALRLAACFVRGEPWPDGRAFEGQPGKVVWCEAEAAQAINLQRATAWGLPRERILCPLDDPLEDFCLGEEGHLASLLSHAGREDVGLVVVDSLSGLHHGDENRAEMIETVKVLAELARDSGKPVLLTHHLRKRGLLDVGQGVTLDRLRGSSAIVQTARVVWALDTPDPGRGEVRRLAVIKSNLADFPPALGMEVRAEGVAFPSAPEAPRNESLQDRAADVIMALLAGGPVPAVEIREEIEAAGISWPTAHKAKDRLGVVSIKRQGRWIWSMAPRKKDQY